MKQQQSLPLATLTGANLLQNEGSRHPAEAEARSDVAGLRYEAFIALKTKHASTLSKRLLYCYVVLATFTTSNRLRIRSNQIRWVPTRTDKGQIGCDQHRV